MIEEKCSEQILQQACEPKDTETDADLVDDRMRVWSRNRFDCLYNNMKKQKNKTISCYEVNLTICNTEQYACIIFFRICC
jgi:hypothetical protein